MSGENIVVEGEVRAVMCCANCGTNETKNDVKLKDCSACHLVKYCGLKCQKHHRKKHKRACKQRAAELRDEILFKQPDSSHLGDCPICFLPLPHDPGKSLMNSCCGKRICKGCDYANDIRERERRLEPKCPFCRKQEPETDEECEKNLEKRAEANDPAALRQIGAVKRDEGDYDNAFKHFTRAAQLGNAMAHYDLSIMYREGDGVETNEEKERYHLEEAAIAGHPDARFNLGLHEGRKGFDHRAVKHFIIAANLGDDDSLQALKKLYKLGAISKDDLAAALRGHQAAIDATKSPQREAAEKCERLGTGGA